MAKTARATTSLKTLRPPTSGPTPESSEAARRFRRVDSGGSDTGALDVPVLANPSDTVVSIRRRREGRQLVDVTGIVLNDHHGFQVAGNLLEPVQ